MSKKLPPDYTWIKSIIKEEKKNDLARVSTCQKNCAQIDLLRRSMMYTWHTLLHYPHGANAGCNLAGVAPVLRTKNLSLGSQGIPACIIVHTLAAAWMGDHPYTIRIWTCHLVPNVPNRIFFLPSMTPTSSYSRSTIVASVLNLF